MPQDDVVEPPPPPTAEPLDADVRTGPTLDVGPPPAISPNRKPAGNNWDAELEAAKEALAQQRPERPQAPAELGATPPEAPQPTPAAPEAAQPPALVVEVL